MKNTIFLFLIFWGTATLALPIDSIQHKNPETELSREKLRSKVLNMYHIVDARYTDDVEFYIDLYTTRYSKSIGEVLGRSKVFFPIFEQYCDKYELPHELKYIAVIESSLKPWAVSKSKAVGLWQIMKSLGQYYQLRIDSQVDEREDIFKSTETAMLYLKSLYEQFDDWTLAMAAYNCGPGRMRRAIRKAGSSDYWEVQQYLPKETQRYIPKYIAFSYMMQYYRDYGIEEIRAYEAYSTDIEYTIIFNKLKFKQISELSGVEMDVIKLLNSSYSDLAVPNNSEGYLMCLPSVSMGTFLANFYADGIDTVFNNINPRYGVIPKYRVKQSGYTVRSGDNLYDLARKFDCKVSELMSWNMLSSDKLKINQRLSVVCRAIDLIPVERNTKYIHDIPSMEKEEITVVQENYSNNSLVMVDFFTPKSAYSYYVVKSRESVQNIADNYEGVSPQDIISLNKLSNRNLLKPGMRIKIGKI